MPSLEGWDLERYRAVLRARATQLGVDPRLRVRESESDLVQETFLRAQASAEPCRGDNDQARLAWLLQIQNRVYLDKVSEHHADKRDISREQAARQALDESTVHWERNLAARQATPSQIAVEREEKDLLEQALQQLPERERAAMVLQLREHLSMAEIADRLGITKGMVAGLIRRGSDRVAELLRGTGEKNDG